MTTQSGKTEIRAYLIDAGDEVIENFYEASHEQIMDRAEETGEVYTLAEFAAHVNTDEISLNNRFVLFKEMPYNV